MSKSVNKVILIGNCGGDPEIRNGRGGKKIATFSMATSRQWKDKTTDEWMEATQWHRIVVFSEQDAELVEREIRKGSQVLVEGEINYRKWHDPTIDGDRWTTEIVISGFNARVQIITKDNMGQTSSSRDGAPQVQDRSEYGAKPSQRQQAGFGQRQQQHDDSEVPF